MLSDEQIKAALALASHSPPVRLPQGWKEFARAIEREARNHALEDAAKACDAIERRKWLALRDGGVIDTGPLACADAIRALKEKP